MLQRILVIIILMSVEFSTIREYFNDFKETIEICDIDDNNENEDLSKKITLDKFFVSKTTFHFLALETVLKTSMGDYILSLIPNPIKAIDLPPPQFFFV
jgi:hypothetical protein